MKRKRPAAHSSSGKPSISLAFAERLRHATQKHEISELAAKLGVTPVTFYRWLSGKFEPSLTKLAELANALNVNLAWLVTGRGPVDSRRALRHALLEEYELVDYAVTENRSDKSPIAFYEPWLFELLFGSTREASGTNTSLLMASGTNAPLLMEVDDDSMEPTIKKGALLLIDRAFGIDRNTLKRAQREGFSPYDGIYVFRLGPAPGRSEPSPGHLVVRRVQYRLEGTIVIKCDNGRYPEEVYAPAAPFRPMPIGRALWHASRI